MEKIRSQINTAFGEESECRSSIPEKFGGTFERRIRRKLNFVNHKKHHEKRK